MLWDIQNQLRFFISSDLGQQVPQHDVHSDTAVQAVSAPATFFECEQLWCQCYQTCLFMYN
jgi:hypothetical protein